MKRDMSLIARSKHARIFSPRRLNSPLSLSWTRNLKKKPVRMSVFIYLYLYHRSRKCHNCFQLLCPLQLQVKLRHAQVQRTRSFIHCRRDRVSGSERVSPFKCLIFLLQRCAWKYIYKCSTQVSQTTDFLRCRPSCVTCHTSAFGPICWPGIGLWSTIPERQLPTVTDGGYACQCYRGLSTASHHSLTHLPLQTGSPMSFFPNSSNLIISGCVFVNNEGTTSDKIEKGKHIFVRL